MCIPAWSDDLIIYRGGCEPEGPKELTKSVQYWHCHQSRETNLVYHERRIFPSHVFLSLTLSLPAARHQDGYPSCVWRQAAVTWWTIRSVSSTSATGHDSLLSQQHFHANATDINKCRHKREMWLRGWVRIITSHSMQQRASLRILSHNEAKESVAGINHFLSTIRGGGWGWQFFGPEIFRLDKWLTAAFSFLLHTLPAPPEIQFDCGRFIWYFFFSLLCSPHPKPRWRSIRGIELEGEQRTDVYHRYDVID